MSLSHEAMLTLMSLADGELEGAEKERAERLVASDDEARQAFADLSGEEVGTWLHESLDQRAGAGSADRIADAVMAAIASGAAGDGVSARVNARVRPTPVTSLDDARSRRKPRLQYLATAGGAFLALAAGVILYVHAQTAQLGGHAPVASVFVPSVDLQGTALAQQGGVEVNEIDAPSVSVFEIPAGAAANVQAAGKSGPSSVVIWVDDDPGAK